MKPRKTKLQLFIFEISPKIIREDVQEISVFYKRAKTRIINHRWYSISVINSHAVESAELFSPSIWINLEIVDVIFRRKYDDVTICHAKYDVFLFHQNWPQSNKITRRSQILCNKNSTSSGVSDIYVEKFIREERY